MIDVLIDGREGRHIDCSDRGLQYGDGLFETISCEAGQPRWLELHLQRLRSGCERLRLPFQDYAPLRTEIGALSQGSERCLVKVVVTRGLARRRGYAPSGDERPTRIVSRHDWPPPVPSEAAGLRLGISPVTLGINPRLAGLKHLNRLEQVLAQQQRDAAREDEVLMSSSAGQVIGGSMSNVFFCDHSGWFTPALNDCGVAGIMRRLVREAAARLGMALPERAVALAELGGMRAAFVTNVRWGVQPVRQLAGRALPGDAQTQALREAIDAAHP
ncbi:MAG: aminodeoxychorismate lyase [Steroidobacteraceae bacterium]